VGEEFSNSFGRDNGGEGVIGRIRGTIWHTFVGTANQRSPSITNILLEHRESGDLGPASERE
jgi:hypothetical protein